MISNAIQTNAILLDKKWCEFLHANNFLVGISIDGPREYHDRYRRDLGGRGTFDKVKEAIKLCKEYKVEFNTLTLLNDVTVSGEARVTTMARALKMTKDLGADFSGFSGTVSAVTKLATWFYGINTVLHTVDGKTPESRLLTDTNIVLNVKTIE